MTTKRLFIIAPPPTPNGGLHIGHLSGPYLGADVYSRIYRDQYDEVHYCVSTDDNQTYVDTTASRLGMDTHDLLNQARQEIHQTFSEYDINLSLFGNQDSDYEPYVIDFYQKLIASGQLSVESVDVFFDEENSQYPVESFVTGICNNCLDQTCGGICETCGFPNDGCSLLGTDSNGLQIVQDQRLVIDLENYREEFETFFSSIYMRPELNRFVSAMLDQKLPKIPLTYRLERGISIEIEGLSEQVLNVWAEMYPGHLYFLQKSAGTAAGNTDKYVQFFGFDNSFFYIFLHKALFFAAQRAGMAVPDVTEVYTNQFYYLENGKFSTSKGHAIWASDLAKEFNPDIVKLYLSMYGPEYEEGSFNRPHFEIEAERLSGIVNALVQQYNDFIQSANGHNGSAANGVQTSKLSLTVPEAHLFSTRSLARESMVKLGYFSERVADNPNLAWEIPKILLSLLHPFTTRYCQSIEATISAGAAVEALPELEIRA